MNWRIHFNMVLICLSWFPKIEIPQVQILHEKMHKHHKSFIVEEWSSLIISLVHNHKWSHRRTKAPCLTFPSLHPPILNRYVSLTSQNNPIKWTCLPTLQICVLQCNLNTSRKKSWAFLLLHVSNAPIHLQRFTRCLFFTEDSCKCRSTSQPE